MSTDPLYPNAKLIAESLQPYLVSTDACAPVAADLNDLLEISRWLIAQMSDVDGKTSSADTLESFLIDLDVQLDHLRFHVNSLKHTVTAALDAFPPDADEGCS